MFISSEHVPGGWELRCPACLDGRRWLLQSGLCWRFHWRRGHHSLHGYGLCLRKEYLLLSIRWRGRQGTTYLELSILLSLFYKIVNDYFVYFACLVCIEYRTWVDVDVYMIVTSLYNKNVNSNCEIYFKKSKLCIKEMHMFFFAKNLYTCKDSDSKTCLKQSPGES